MEQHEGEWIITDFLFMTKLTLQSNIHSIVAYLHLYIHAVWLPKPLRNQSSIQQDRIYCKCRMGIWDPDTPILKNPPTAVNVSTWTLLHWSTLPFPDRWWGLKGEKRDTFSLNPLEYIYLCPIKQHIWWLPWWHYWLMSTFPTKIIRRHVCVCVMCALAIQ